MRSYSNWITQTIEVQNRNY